MTAVEFLKQKLTSIFVNDKGFNKLFEQAKEMEKQQIKDAWFDGYGGSAHSEDEYYNETYGSKGSDVAKRMIKEMPKVADKLVSDEDIEKQALSYFNEHHCNVFEYDAFIAGVKWYREQLKSKH